MRSRRLVLGACAGLCAAAALVAQVPAHAVLLNPQVGLDTLRFCRSGATLHLVGRTMQPTPGFVHYARSTDGGRTWPQRELPLAFATALGGLAATGDHVHVACNAAYTGPHVMSSFDGGATWGPPLRVSVASNVMGAAEPLLHANGDVVNVVWFEQRPGGSYQANRSVDGGLTFGALDVPLAAGLPAATTEGLPLLVAHGDSLHVFWSSVQPQVYTAHQRSLDGGATWLPTPQLLSTSASTFVAGSPDVLLATDYAAVDFQRSVDQGTTWHPVTGHGITRIAALAANGPLVLLVGYVAAQPASTVQLQVSRDRGATWLPTPYLVPAARQWSAQAQATRDALFVHFTFVNDGFQPPGVVIQSDDFGISWRLVGGAAGRSVHASDDGAIVLAKTGYSGTDVLAWVLEGHTALGTGTSGASGRVPTLAGRGLSGLGRTFSLDVEQAPDGALGAVFGAFGPAVSVPFGRATLWVAQPIVTAAFTTGAQGTAGAGTASLLVPVPNTPALAGHRLVAQALVLDSGTSDGFAATNGVESWLW